jgi:hypothetical protein
MKKLYFLVLLSSVTSFGQTQIGADIDGKYAGDEIGWSVSMSQDGSVVATGGYESDYNGICKGVTRVYKNISGVWTQVGQDIFGENPNDWSGTSISLSNDGNTLAVGAPKNDGNGTSSGHVRVFQNILNNWVKIGQDIDGKADGDLSGTSVSLSADGTIVAIGATDESYFNQDTFSYVRIFKNVSGNWIQIGDDINQEAVRDLSGTSVSLSADGYTIAIGAIGNDGFFNNGCGHVRIFRYVLNNWIKVGQDLDGQFSADGFGDTVSMSADGSIVAIGSKNTFLNSVKVYQNINDTWFQLGQNIIDNWYPVSSTTTSGKIKKVTLSGDGSIIAISENRYIEPTYKGRVSIYKYFSGNWTAIGQNIDGENTFDFSGEGISLSKDGTKIAIGSSKNSGNNINLSGHVRVFDLSALLASDTFVLDNFSIYPNPTSDILNITLENNLTLEKVNIYSTLGQLIK